MSPPPVSGERLLPTQLLASLYAGASPTLIAAYLHAPTVASHDLTVGATALLSALTAPALALTTAGQLNEGGRWRDLFPPAAVSSIVTTTAMLAAEHGHLLGPGGSGDHTKLLTVLVMWLGTGAGWLTAITAKKLTRG